MKRTFVKGIFKDIRRSLGRFFSIIAIIALGVGFLVGIMAVSPTILKSFDAGYKTLYTPDVTYKYAAGVDKDAAADLVESHPEIEAVLGRVSDGKLSSDSGINYLARVYEYPASYLAETTRLVTGRYPTDETEALALVGTNKMASIPLGMGLSSAQPGVIEQSLGIGLDLDGVKVVGAVTSPLFVSRESEPSYISSRPLDTVIFRPLDPTYTVVTDIAVRFPSLAGLYRFGDGYFDALTELSAPLKEELDALKSDRTPKLQSQLDAAFTLGLITEAQHKLYLAVLKAPFQELTLQQNSSYLYLKASVQKVEKIVAIFPPFFFFVAALVALTSITRLVEEDRTLIGTYKALGYTKNQIAAKYLVYGGLSSTVGSLLGLAGGIMLLPLIIYNAFGTNFVMPAFLLDFNLLGSLLSFFAAIIVTGLVSLLSVISSLRESPAALMIPKSPKPGTRILAERIPAVWKRLHFKSKATLRNLFRYKKHFIMTVIGILGSTALLFGGFALRDSFTALSDVTYNELRRYQLSVEGAVDEPEFAAAMEETGSEYIVYSSLIVEFRSPTETLTAELVAVDDDRVDEFMTYMVLRDEKSKKPFELVSDSYYVSAQIADRLDLKRGSEASFTYSGREFMFTVGGAAENYLDNYLFMTASGYEALMGFAPVHSKALIRTDVATLSAAMQKLESLGSVTSIVSSEASRDSYTMLLNSMKMVDAVLIAAALILAVIIVYNITTVSISERKRELATLKVLGYASHETAGYVMRSIFIQSAIGLLLGLLGGLALAFFVIVSCETIGIRFGRDFSWHSYVLTVVLMLGFIGLVDLVMLPKIKKINPAESLKSVE